MKTKLLIASVAVLTMVPLVLLAQTKSKPEAKAPLPSIAIALEKGG